MSVSPYKCVLLADDCSDAVVGHPGRDDLWILSRTTKMPRAIDDSIGARLGAQGSETSRLVLTTQSAQATAPGSG